MQCDCSCTLFHLKVNFDTDRGCIIIVLFLIFFPAFGFIIIIQLYFLFVRTDFVLYNIVIKENVFNYGFL